MIPCWFFIATAMAGDTVQLETAVKAEIARSIEELKLPDQEGPYHVSVDILEGSYTMTEAELGVEIFHENRPHRTARVDVRVGDASLDSSNFSGAFGTTDGLGMRGLAHEDVEVATRRELWLAIDSAYKGATETFAAKKAAREGQATDRPPDLSPAPVIQLPAMPIREPAESKMRLMTQQLSSALQEHSHLDNSGVLSQDWHGRRLHANSEGTTAWLPTGRTVVRAEVIARAEDGARLRNTRTWIAQNPTVMPSQDSMMAELQEASLWLKKLQSAPIQKDYLGPVLFEEQAAMELFRQLLHQEISGTPPQESAPDPLIGDSSPIPWARIGRRLLPSGWTVVDDPTSNPQATGYYTHDFDAVAATRVEVVTDGVLKDVLMSRIPRSKRLESTGHGRSMGADRRVAMPAQVTVTPNRGKNKKTLRRKALQYAREAGLPYVLVVRRMTPPAISEDFQFAVTGDAPLAGLTSPTEVYRLYPDGREEPVRGLRFVGVDRRVLRDIMASGKISIPRNALDSPGASARFSLGHLSGLPVMWAAPEVVIGELELHGSGGGEHRVIPKP
jgi:predicted Zn-dependent protease